MKKILFGGVSLISIVAVGNAMAAGYTCEELVVYESCSEGYYMQNGAGICPDGYTWRTGVCLDNSGEVYFGVSAAKCECDSGWDSDACMAELGEDGSGHYGNYYGDMCLLSGITEGMSSNDSFREAIEEYLGGSMDSGDESLWKTEHTGYSTVDCLECQAGSYCVGGKEDTAVMTRCPTGTYQPDSKQVSCIDAPAGSYVAVTGATSYTACSAGTYQPNTGQSSCLSCLAGSYCATAGLEEPTGLCEAGSYSTGGATSAKCTTCPQFKYTNEDDEAVYVTATSAVGADAPNKCAIASNQTFADKKGTYTFNESCYYVAPTTYSEACALNYEYICGVITEDNQFFCVESGDTSEDDCGCDYHLESFIFNEETGEFYCEAA